MSSIVNGEDYVTSLAHMPECVTAKRSEGYEERKEERQRERGGEGGKMEVERGGETLPLILALGHFLIRTAQPSSARGQPNKANNET